jgi:hypothetical protein
MTPSLRFCGHPLDNYLIGLDILKTNDKPFLADRRLDSWRLQAQANPAG